MILYFSGTGNSRFVAEKLAALLSEKLLNLEEVDGELPALAANEPLGMIFPVYAWGVPGIVEDFLRHKVIGSRYLWAVMTCGDDMGYADRVLEKLLQRRLDAAFSLQMPNTYVCLPGFDVDSPALAEKKVRESTERLPHIAQCIKARKNARALTRGGAAWLKTYVLRPAFNAWLVTDKYFHHSDACTSCGLCANKCPKHDIVMVDDHPQWQHKGCTGCLRCYHHCPKRAIDWGRFTHNKQQKKRL